MTGQAAGAPPVRPALEVARPGGVPPVMPAEVGEWIRAYALTAWYLAAASPAGECPCQYGSCGWCASDNHARCSRRPPQPVAGAEAYIVNRSGRVAASPDVASTAVRRPGRQCRQICSCPCPSAPAQLTLFT